jgi:MFS family permease
MARVRRHVAHAQRPKLAPPPRRLAMGIFWLLTAINFLNYLDRIVFVAVDADLKHDFHLSDAQVGATASAFLLIYTLAALPLGALADRLSRTRIVAIGVAIWSIATWYTAVAHTFAGLFAGRAVLGIGEASYLPAGAALLAAYFAPGERATVQSRWGASSLVGSAAGFVLGGIIAQHFGWRWAFVLCGAPGLVLALLAWRAPDRVAYDSADLGAHRAMLRARPMRGGVRAAIAALVDQSRQVLRSPTVRLSVVVQALGLFASTPAVVFVPIYLREHFHRSTQTTALLAGGVLVPAGVLGALLGGTLANALSRRYASGRMLAVGIGFACAVPFFIAGLMAQNLIVLLVLSFFAVLFMNVFNGPINAAVQDVIMGPLRATAAAVIMTLAHLLGDVSSPTLVGTLAGHLAKHNVAHALAILGAPALALAALVALWGAPIYARELRHSAKSAESSPSSHQPVALAPHA